MKNESNKNYVNIKPVSNLNALKVATNQFLCQFITQ